MARLEFKHCILDAGVYYFICGNDIIIAIKKEFMKIWECRDLGEPREFLQMQITRD
uniref:Uncharacterized protein n=1 Tax=Moniliophthora roreri TaxID=221103 RepID=A0A0W0FHX5_MONRR